MSNPEKLTWHSLKPNTAYVFHDNPECWALNRIAEYNRAEGTDGRPLCGICESLNRRAVKKNTPHALSIPERFNQ